MIWPKLVEFVRYWQSLPKTKQPGQGKPEGSKSHQCLASSFSDALLPLRLAFFEEVAKKLIKFLRRFQTDSPVVSFLVDTIEEILKDFCGRFILSDIMSKTVKTVDLIEISIGDLGIALRHDIGVLKKKGMISDMQIARFKEDGKNSLVTLANHIATKTSVQSYFARCARSLNPIYMVDNPDAWKRLLDCNLAKLISTKHFSSEFAD